MFQLAHRLFERSTFGTHQVLNRHTHVGIEHLAEVAIGGHVGDGAHFDARRIHRHDNFADTCVWRPLFSGATNQITKVGEFAET
ncbi:MAG: hypothetical protein ACKOE7_07125, partial [Actinomycetota bacterium]